MKAILQSDGHDWRVRKICANHLTARTALGRELVSVSFERRGTIRLALVECFTVRNIGDYVDVREFFIIKSLHVSG